MQKGCTENRKCYFDYSILCQLSRNRTIVYCSIADCYESQGSFPSPPPTVRNSPSNLFFLIEMEDYCISKSGVDQQLNSGGVEGEL